MNIKRNWVISENRYLSKSTHSRKHWLRQLRRLREAKQPPTTLYLFLTPKTLLRKKLKNYESESNPKSTLVVKSWPALGTSKEPSLRYALHLWLKYNLPEAESLQIALQAEELHLQITTDIFNAYGKAKDSADTAKMFRNAAVWTLWTVIGGLVFGALAVAQSRNESGMFTLLLK